MKEKIKGILTGNFYVAAMIALTGAALCLFMCTLFLAGGLFIRLAPLWLFAVFTAMYFVLETIPQTTGRWYIKVLVSFVAAAVFVILLVLFD